MPVSVVDPVVPTFCQKMKSPENVSVAEMCNEFNWLFEHFLGSVSFLFSLPAGSCHLSL